jgi:uncharacterized membrane protein YqjE
MMPIMTVPTDPTASLLGQALVGPPPEPAPGVAMAGGRQPSVGELATKVSSGLTQLVRAEMELAKIELSTAAKRAGAGAGLLGGAALFLVTAWLLASVGLAEVVHANGLSIWAGFLIVAGGYLLVGALLALLGAAGLKRVRAPERTIDSVKGDIAALRDRGHSNGTHPTG